MVRNWYPLPLIPELIAEVQDTFVFSKFDVEGGFNKVLIKDRDQYKAAFKTKYGLYEPMVMYFSLCNSPETFQNMMNHIFWPLKDKWAKKGVKIIVYMDDILIVTNQGIGPRWTNTKPPCHKGNKHRTCPFGFPTGLGPDGPREIHMVTL